MPDHNLDKYLPVSLDFIDLCNDELIKLDKKKIHFFNTEMKVDQVVSNEFKLIYNEQGVFLLSEQTEWIRLDKIITLAGKPGPAYDEYALYAHCGYACTNESF